MPNCRYVILNYHSTEMSRRGRPLVMLLEYSGDCGDRQRSSYLLSDLNTIVEGMPFELREWLILVLCEVSIKQFHPDLDTEEMFTLYSFLNVGPLRTTHSGRFNCESLDAALQFIRGNVVSETKISGEDCSFADFLSPLDPAILRSIDMPSF